MQRELGGLTREEATAKVREAYQALYFEAEVSLQITEAMSKTYTVAGEVSRPAEFPYLKPITLLDAIVAAGGLRVNQRGGDSFVGGQGQLVKAIIIRGTGAERNEMSSRKRPNATASSKSRLVAATTRASLRTGTVPPMRTMGSPSSTWSNLTCTWGAVSQISSRKSVPSCAISKRPGLEVSAPVKAPRS